MHQILRICKFAKSLMARLFASKSLTESLESSKSLAKGLAKSLGSDYMHDSQRVSPRLVFLRG